LVAVPALYFYLREDDADGLRNVEEGEAMNGIDQSPRGTIKEDSEGGRKVS
jgi:hypothetical protein